MGCNYFSITDIFCIQPLEQVSYKGIYEYKGIAEALNIVINLASIQL